MTKDYNKTNNGSNQDQDIREDSDDFDFLESLMQDLSGSSEASSVNDNLEEVVTIESDTTNDGIADGINAKENTVIEKPKVERRVPLFQQMGFGKSSEKESEERDFTPETLTDGNKNDDKSNSNNTTYTEKKTEEEVVQQKKPGLFEGLFDEETSSESVEVEEIQEGDNEQPGVIEDSVNLIDGMLDEFDKQESEDKVEVLKEKRKVDSEVIVPLETKEMSEVKVTADGRTLAEMLPGRRSGQKTVSQVFNEIKNQETVVEVDGKKFSDNRYTKHVEEINSKREEQDERRKLSKSFLQRNASFTEQEKIIMENLGVSNKGFTELMKSTELTKEDKEGILGLGRYGAERHFNGRKYRTTVGDTAMLEFLVKFKFANTRILRWISNEPQGRTWRKLNRLRENGLVESQTLIGIPDLWAATGAGVGISGYDLDPGLRPMPKMTTVSSTMGINYIAACLWFNSVNVLNLEDFPAHNRVIALQEDGRERVRGEMIVSELEIRSSLGKEINPNSTTMQNMGDERLYDVISDNVRNSFHTWRENGMNGSSPETLLGNEYMWILFPKSQLTLSYHVPDLVVVRERGPNGEPKSIAVEMERYEKTNDKYDKIMLAYKLDTDLYEKVVWITPNSRVARALERAAQSVGLTNYAILPIITETGTYSKQDIWMI